MDRARENEAQTPKQLSPGLRYRMTAMMTSLTILTSVTLTQVDSVIVF